MRGVKLAEIMKFLVDEYGWETLAEEIKINCFMIRPSIKSSLRFLRKTPWALDEVEQLYLYTIRDNMKRDEEGAAE